MATPTVARRLSYSDVLVQGSRPRSEVQGSHPPSEAPYQVGELVYATVLVESPMSAFRSSCEPKLRKKEKREAERAEKTRRLKEEAGEIEDKGPRPCIILSTKKLPKDKWEYQLCLLTSFSQKGYSELPADPKRLALPVSQEGDQPNECEDETRIPAFVLKPAMKQRPDSPHSYLIGYPITRSGSCIQTRAIDDVKRVMDFEEVKRLKKYCDWIKEQKREVSSK